MLSGDSSLDVNFFRVLYGFLLGISSGYPSETPFGIPARVKTKNQDYDLGISLGTPEAIRSGYSEETLEGILSPGKLVQGTRGRFLEDTSRGFKKKNLGIFS